MLINRANLCLSTARHHKSPYIVINPHAAVELFSQILSFVHETGFVGSRDVLNFVRSVFVGLPEPQDLSSRGGIEQVTITLSLINTIVL